MSLQYALLNDTSWQSQTDWQTPDTPFMSFAFWQALADTGAIGEQAGWLPIFVLVHRVADSQSDSSIDYADHSENYSAINEAAQTVAHPVAVLPIFLKGHHRGEFVFDHSWAEAMRVMVWIIIQGWLPACPIHRLRVSGFGWQKVRR